MIFTVAMFVAACVIQPLVILIVAGHWRDIRTAIQCALRWALEREQDREASKLVEKRKLDREIRVACQDGILSEADLIEVGLDPSKYVFEKPTPLYALEHYVSRDRIESMARAMRQVGVSMTDVAMALQQQSRLSLQAQYGNQRSQMLEEQAQSSRRMEG